MSGTLRVQNTQPQVSTAPFCRCGVNKGPDFWKLSSRTSLLDIVIMVLGRYLVFGGGPQDVPQPPGYPKQFPINVTLYSGPYADVHVSSQSI